MALVLLGDEEPDEFGVAHARVGVGGDAVVVGAGGGVAGSVAGGVVGVAVIGRRRRLGQFVVRRASRHGARKDPVDHSRTDCCNPSMARHQSTAHAQHRPVALTPNPAALLK